MPGLTGEDFKEKIMNGVIEPLEPRDIILAMEQEISPVNFGYLEPRVRFALDLKNSGVRGEALIKAIEQFDRETGKR